MGQLGVHLPRPFSGLPRHQQRLQQRQRAENAQQKRWQEMQQVKEKGKVLQGGEPRIGLWNHRDFMGSWWFLFRDFMGFSLRSWLIPPRIVCWKQIFRPGSWGLWINAHNWGAPVVSSKVTGNSFPDGQVHGHVWLPEGIGTIWDKTGDIMADHGRMKSTTCVGFLKMAWTPVLIQELHWSLANQWLKAVPFLMSKRRGSHLPLRAFLRGRWMTIMGGNSWRGSRISLKMLTRPVCIVQLPKQSSIA